MAEMESRIVQATLREKPANATHWSTRTLAEHLGVGATTVRTAWRNNGLNAYSTQTGQPFHVKLDTHSTPNWTVGA
jgi:hypothetical protein